MSMVKLGKKKNPYNSLQAEIHFMTKATGTGTHQPAQSDHGLHLI